MEFRINTDEGSIQVWDGLAYVGEFFLRKSTVPGKYDLSWYSDGQKLAYVNIHGKKLAYVNIHGKFIEMP